MWRITDSSGEPFQNPEPVVFNSTTGYNVGKRNVSPYPDGQMHYYCYKTADKELKKLKNQRKK